MLYIWIMEYIDIEKALYPEAWELKYCEESQSFKALIVDTELDPLEVEFHSDDTIQINTEGYTHITLDQDSLVQLLSLMSKAEDLYEEMG